MSSADIAAAAPADSPESQKYNRIHRWLGMADFGLGLGMLALLLATGWNAHLRDLAYRAAFQHYVPALTLYVLMLLAIGKILGFGLDFYGFRLEHQFHLSNLKLRSWLKDEAKGFLLGFVLAAIVIDLLYFIIRQYPLHWWLLAWAVFLGLVVLLAQLAPVILFPIFYRFEPAAK